MINRTKHFKAINMNHTKFKSIFMTLAVATSLTANFMPVFITDALAKDDMKQNIINSKINSKKINNSNNSNNSNISPIQEAYVKNVVNVYKEVLDVQFNHYNMSYLQQKIQSSGQVEQSPEFLTNKQQLQLAYTVSQNLEKYNAKSPVSLSLTYEVVAQSLSQLFPNVISKDILKEQVEKNMFEESLKAKLENKDDVQSSITKIRGNNKGYKHTAATI